MLVAVCMWSQHSCRGGLLLLKLSSIEKKRVKINFKNSSSHFPISKECSFDRMWHYQSCILLMAWWCHNLFRWKITGLCCVSKPVDRVRFTRISYTGESTINQDLLQRRLQRSTRHNNWQSKTTSFFKRQLRSTKNNYLSTIDGAIDQRLLTLDSTPETTVQTGDNVLKLVHRAIQHLLHPLDPRLSIRTLSVCKLPLHVQHEKQRLIEQRNIIWQEDSIQVLNNQEKAKMAECLDPEKQNISQQNDEIFRFKLESQNTAVLQNELQLKVNQLEQQLCERDKVILDLRKENDLSHRLETIKNLQNRGPELLGCDKAWQREYQAVQEKFREELTKNKTG